MTEISEMETSIEKLKDGEGQGDRIL